MAERPTIKAATTVDITKVTKLTKMESRTSWRTRRRCCGWLDRQVLPLIWIDPSFVG
jgi:hypothetical protein